MGKAMRECSTYQLPVTVADMKDKPLALGAHVKYHSADPDHSTRVGTIVAIDQSHR
ncbi:unnamed protein product, partial [marine sediment metagenome]